MRVEYIYSHTILEYRVSYLLLIIFETEGEIIQTLHSFFIRSSYTLTAEIKEMRLRIELFLKFFVSLISIYTLYSNLVSILTNFTSATSFPIFR